MLCSLFSIFDPSCTLLSFSFQVKWFSLLIVMSLISWQYYIGLTGLSYLVFYLFKVLNSMVSILFHEFYKKVNIMVVSLFLLLFTVNEVGMMPFLFTCSSHLSYNLSLSVPMWFGGMIYMFYRSWENAMSHFVPLGCPSVLILFLCLVESVSCLIRPFSLGVRLMSNIMAGHLIIVLFSGIISDLFSNPSFPFLVVIQSVIVGFEIMVALVQAYVFTNLMLLYWQENS